MSDPININEDYSSTLDSIQMTLEQILDQIRDAEESGYYYFSITIEPQPKPRTDQEDHHE